MKPACSLILISVLLLLFFAAPGNSYGAENPTVDVAPEEGIPLAGPQETAQPAASPSSFLDNLYMWMLGLVGLASLFALVYGGVLYIFSGAVESTAEARRWITNAIWGLILAGLSFIILRTINPELVRKFDIENIIRRGEGRLR